MVANADLNKWICVSAETADAAVNGDYVLFVMSGEATTKAMIQILEEIPLK